MVATAVELSPECAELERAKAVCLGGTASSKHHALRNRMLSELLMHRRFDAALALYVAMATEVRGDEVP